MASVTSIPWRFLKAQMAGPHLLCLLQQVCGGTWEFAFITHSQMILKLLVQGLYFESQWTKDIHRAKQRQSAAISKPRHIFKISPTLQSSYTENYFSLPWEIFHAARSGVPLRFLLGIWFFKKRSREWKKKKQPRKHQSHAARPDIIAVLDRDEQINHLSILVKWSSWVRKSR